MNLVCGTSKVRGLGKDTSPAGRLGKTVWLFLLDQRDQGEDGLKREGKRK